MKLYFLGKEYNSKLLEHYQKIEFEDEYINIKHQANSYWRYNNKIFFFPTESNKALLIAEMFSDYSKFIGYTDYNIYKNLIHLKEKYLSCEGLKYIKVYKEYSIYKNNFKIFNSFDENRFRIMIEDAKKDTSFYNINWELKKYVKKRLNKLKK